MCVQLNFLQRNIAKDKDTVIKIAANFFAKDAINQAQDIYKTVLKFDALERCTGLYPTATFLADFHNLLSFFST